MRAIKFRAWDTVMKDWVPMGVNHISDLVRIKATKKKGEFLIDTFDSGSRRLILMQFTGLKDRNGKEIYEGDIIKYHYFYFADGSEIEKEHVCSVKYDDSFANFDAMDKEGFAHFLGNASDDGIEIIGNIHENPELLQ